MTPHEMEDLQPRGIGGRDGSGYAMCIEYCAQQCAALEEAQTGDNQDKAARLQAALHHWRSFAGNDAWEIQLPILHSRVGMATISRAFGAPAGSLKALILAVKRPFGSVVVSSTAQANVWSAEMEKLA